MNKVIFQKYILLALLIIALFGLSAAGLYGFNRYKQLPTNTKSVLGVTQTTKKNVMDTSKNSRSIDRKNLLSKINTYRMEHELPVLSLNDNLDTAAAEKAKDMLNNNYWSNISPSGKSPWDLVQATGYSYVSSAELLARDYDDVVILLDAWRSNTEYNSSLLTPSFEHIGISIQSGIIDNLETTLVVVLLADQNGPKSASKTIQNNPTTTTTNLKASLIDCTGPDGVVFQTTSTECESFNTAWNNVSNTTETPSGNLIDCHMSLGVFQITLNECLDLNGRVGGYDYKDDSYPSYEVPVYNSDEYIPQYQTHQAPPPSNAELRDDCLGNVQYDYQTQRTKLINEARAYGVAGSGLDSRLDQLKNRYENEVSICENKYPTE
jgi:uncharacterized protein YkwD